jgi:tetratricopeptide (TPR) repeat protein
VYPYYHRKYIFVSLGGYWPFGYSYRRYYWYGCHPYSWYGYYPIARQVQGDTYNYYTYNYYDGEQVATYQSQVADPALFENLAEPQTEPAETSLADMYFEEAVKAFEVAEYNTAIAKFKKAMELAPNDMILPFALSQAMMAGGQYSQAAAVLRDALARVRPDQEGVFYPRGLYPDEQTLLEQIDLLAEQAEKYSFDADLQLLLGYQLLGIGNVDRAVEPLMNAKRDLANADAAAVLLDLLEKVKASNGRAEPEDKPKNPDPAPASGKAIIKGDTIRLKESMLLASFCALVTTAGIRHFTHG